MGAPQLVCGFVLLTALCLDFAIALYSSSSPVKVLSAAEFSRDVINGNEIYIVEFFADWCGHCKQFAPEYEKAAKALKGVVKVVAVDDQSVISSVGVSGFPTVKARVGGTWKDFDGGRSAAAVVDFALAELKVFVKARLSGKGGPSSEKKESKPSGPSEVVVLTDKNFDEKVMKDEKSTWFIEFYAPWCGHCKSLAPEWESAAKELAGKVKVAKVDATTETVLASRFGIKGFPTLMLFPGGPKKDSLTNKYEGPRRASDIVEYALQHATTQTEAEQLLKEDQFREDCGKGLCILTFLPHIFDSMAEGRNQYLKTLNSIVKSSATMPLKFLWSQAGDQFDFEEQMHLAFGYPAVVAVNLERKKYTVHRGDFGQESIRSFITNLMTGTAPVSDLPDLKKLSIVEAWDGKDGELPKEEL
eukprot:GHVN01060128.1.p1 GENE.GHVN01060128.1~~GHVN01060128.1.p1  ORF type:complete len:416 (-),score=45.51 GHVN01060128.1:2065-3312(-)